MHLESIKSQWRDYRRALRRHDKPPYDQLFEYADAHADAAGYLNADTPFHPIVFSMLLEQQKKLNDLEARLETIENTGDAVQD